MEFRCSSRIHFVRRGDLAETKCHSKRCGAGNGVVVLHTFNINTGEIINTQKFKDPMYSRKGVRQHAAHNDSASVRSA